MPTLSTPGVASQPKVVPTPRLHKSKAPCPISATTIRTALREWRDVLVALQRRLNCQGGCPIGTIVAELAEINSPARESVAAGFARWEEPIRNGLQTMYERGELAGDPAQLATATLAALQGGLLLSQVRRTTEPLEAALDAIIDRIESLTR